MAPEPDAQWEALVKLFDRPVPAKMDGQLELDLGDAAASEETDSGKDDDDDKEARQS